MNPDLLSPTQLVAHLRPDVWADVNAALVAKAIGELAHERLIEPTPVDTDDDGDRAAPYRLTTDFPGTEYRFRARRMSLDHWAIDRASLAKYVDGLPAPLDALRLVVELRERLGMSPTVLPAYLEDLAATLYAAAWKHAHPGPNAAALAGAGLQEIEAAMTEGHPVFIANSGRIGFNTHDHRAYAPELAAPVHLVWLAAHVSRVDVACAQELDYARLLDEELGAATLAGFARILRDRGVAPAAYRFLPVHPWQWQNRIAQLFAHDLATDALIYLGVGDDAYQAQQSIRTLFNTSQPTRRYVKTALSILNMGFSRGMSATLAPRAAAVNDWVGALVGGDAYLCDLGFALLREVAFIGVRHRHYERAVTRRSDGYKEMLAALWRESPVARLGAGQRAMTMAALLHVDRDGAALLPALIRASGLDSALWVRRYLRAYLTPQLHCFYAHDLVFTPHGENILLVLEGDVPVGTFIKDLAEDIAVLDPEAPLPATVRHLALRVSDDLATLCIFTDIFDGVFRFLARILDEHAGLPEAQFWRLVADCVHAYGRDQPHLRAKLARFDLFAPSFGRNCLNRLQLTNNRQMIDLNAPDPAASLQFAGTLPNPIAPFRAAEHVAATGEEPHVRV